MLKELSLPCTPVHWNSSLDGDTQSIDLKPYKSVNTFSMDKGKRILSAWISNQLIALAFISGDHNLYCDHALESVLIVGETRVQPMKIPVRSCVTCIYSSPAVKGILLVGTILGDIYVFKLSRQAGGKCCYVELHHQTGDGMITTFSLFKSASDCRAALFISGQIDGRINTWIFDKQNEKITPGQVYSIDRIGSPILIIETISETSFCLYRRGSAPLTIYDINNYTTNTKERSKTIMLVRGKECKGVDPVLEISNIEYQTGDNQILITSRQGDILSVKFTNGEPSHSLTPYRTPHINISSSVLIPKPLSVICLTTDGILEIYDITTGAKKLIPITTQITHISLSTDKDRLLATTAEGSIEILSVIIE